MSSGTVSLIIVLVILIFMSAYFSATETAFSSLNKIRMKSLANSGNKRAGLVMELSEDYDKLLSTILIGNNIVNIASASLATIVFVAHFGDAGVSLSTVVMTIVVLIFGEISPKSLSKESPEAWAMIAAPSLKLLLWILYPVNFLFSLWKKFLSRFIHINCDNGITEEELLTMLDEVQQDGGIDEQEGELIRSAIEFNDLEAKDILTPRINMISVSEKEEKEAISETFAVSGYSRLPVFRENIDDIIGVINQKDFHNMILHTDNPVSSITKPVIFVTPSMKISKLLKLLQIKHTHIAIVTDEYGGTMGLVTMEDIIEELVGEIWDEHDEAVDEYEQLTECTYKVSCCANLEKMFKKFHIDYDSEYVTTVGGWVAMELDKIPKEGDTFQFRNLHIKVLKTKRRKADEILIEIIGDII